MLPWLEAIVRDVAFGVRMLRKNATTSPWSFLWPGDGRRTAALHARRRAGASTAAGP
jgi:hypothetical protein